MLTTIVQDITAKVKVQLPLLVEDLEETLSFEAFERALRGLTQDLIVQVVEPVLNQVLQDEAVLRRLRQGAGTIGYKYKEHRPLTVRVVEGVKVQVQSPYFTKKARKRGKKKRGPMGGAVICCWRCWDL